MSEDNIRVIHNKYTPHSKQRNFHLSKKKFRAIITGIGYGKSVAGANETIKTALQYPKAVHLIMAPNNKILQNATLVQFWKFCPRELVQEHRKSENKIILVGGATIIYLTADNDRHIDRLRGIEIGSGWLDEAALFKRLAWDVILGRLRDSDGPLTLWLTTTPKGMYHWIYWLFVKKQDPQTKRPLPNPEDYDWFGGTTHDNPYTPEEYKKTLELSYSGAFKRQEIYGQFEAFAGMVYDNFRREEHVLKQDAVEVREIDEGRETWVTVPGRSPVQIVEWIAGIDFGFTNPMAAGVIGLDHDDRAYILDEFYRSRQKISTVSEWFFSKMEFYGIDSLRIYGDPSSPGNLHELTTLGHEVYKADNNVLEGITTVYGLFGSRDDGTKGLYVVECCIELLEEIGKYHYKDHKDGVETKEAPEKVEDHAVDFCRYSLRTHLGRPGGSFTPLDDPDDALGLG